MIRSISNSRMRLSLAAGCAFLALIVGLIAAPQHASSAEAEAKEVAPPGHITFVGENMLMTANGVFKKWKVANVRIDEANPEKSVIELEIDVASLDTKIEKRDVHLRTADFFDVEQFPTATVKIYDAKAKVGATGPHPIYTCKMDFSIHGVKKTFDTEFELLSSNPITVRGKIVMNRVDFGIGEPYAKFNPMSIQEEIPLEFEATLPKAL